MPTANEIAAHVGGEVTGNGDVSVSRLAAFGEPGALTWSSADYPRLPQAGCVLLSRWTHDANWPDRATVRVNNPRLALGLCWEGFAALKGGRHSYRYDIHPGTEGSFEIVVGHGVEWYPQQRRWVKFPQLGGIAIHKGCQFGAGVRIALGALTDTIVGEHVSVGHGVQIGHGCCIGDGVLIASRALLCGSVTVGHGTRIGAGALIREGVHIGAGAVVGMGAVVLEDVPDGETWVGNPARRLRP